MNSTDQAYLKLARTSPEKCQEVSDYYRKCLRLARHKQEADNHYRYMLASLKKIKDKHDTQYNLI